MPENYQSDRSDMVEYMTEASEKNEWDRPSVGHSIDPHISDSLLENVETSTLFEITVGGDSIHTRRVDGTTNALHARYLTGRDEIQYRLGYYGENSSDLRYWLLQAEIHGRDLEIHEVSDDCMECMMSVQPPEWKGQIRELIEKYRV